MCGRPVTAGTIRSGHTNAGHANDPICRRLLLAVAALFAGGVAFAGMGQPSPWQMGFQQSAAPSMDDIIDFHNLVLWIIIAITVFVLALLLIIIVKFNAKANPTPSKTTHNTLLEVAWTVIPVVILVVIAIPSFRMLFKQLNIPQSDLTIKAAGNQWNWTYTYPDDKIEFTSIMLQDADRQKLNPVPPRLLAVDNPIVVPGYKGARQVSARRDQSSRCRTFGRPRSTRSRAG
jgi:cytochrome c oxidase subunit 2